MISPPVSDFRVRNHIFSTKIPGVSSVLGFIFSTRGMTIEFSSSGTCPIVWWISDLWSTNLYHSLRPLHKFIS